jgi:DNA-binding XRE family transcriptional regulator
MRYVYSIYDNKTDEPIVIGGTVEQCAKVLGIRPESFRAYVRRGKQINRTVIKSYAFEFEETFSARLREARYNAHMSQVRLANIIGVRTSTIRGYETGKRMPNIEIAARIARALNISISDLIGEREK